MSETGTDYPLTLAGAHGRIAAYRAALGKAAVALQAAYPYVNGVALDSSNSSWRITTAKESLAYVEAAQDLIERELAVTNP